MNINRTELIKKIKATCDPIEKPITTEEIEYLVDKCIEYINAKMDPREAVRLTYGCLYQKSDLRFDPRARIAELKK